MKEEISIHWFRQDLRISDNPALTAAISNHTVMPIYILDDKNAGAHTMGAASKYWLHHSLISLKASLNGNLSIYKGDPLSILLGLASRYNLQEIHWNRSYEPWCIKRDQIIKAKLISENIKANSHNGSLLWEPWNISKSDGSHYKVFTPFYRKGCLSAEPPRRPLESISIDNLAIDDMSIQDLADLSLLPDNTWDNKLSRYWEMGEQAAADTLDKFVKEGLHSYKDGRNFPAKPYVSRLSPYLHFGEISPNQVWYTVSSITDDQHVDHFCSELGWREFSYSQLYYNPDLPTKNLQTKFDAFAWSDNHENLIAWQQGLTGVPMVDAGMRELWETGYMHNRVRMIVGSFLVKNLLLHWHHGERWFWDTLVDADLANNSASWQWIAGCGADAAPYFRIFNPVTQGQKFDTDGEYIRKFIPEIKKLPNKYLFSPWEAPSSILQDAGVVLGQDYPEPIVNLSESRNRALSAFQALGSNK